MANRLWVYFIGACLLSVSFVPAGMFFDLGRFQGGARAGHYLGTAVVFLPLYLVFVFSFLVGPVAVTRFVIPGEKPGRVLLLGSIVSLPLLSLAYYLGEWTEGFQLYDLLISTVAPVAAGLICFWRTGRAGLSGFFMATLSFTTLFIVADVLGPFRTLWTYVSNTAAFYPLRTLAAVLPVVWAAHFPLTPGLASSNRDFAYALMSAVGVGLFLSTVSSIENWLLQLRALDVTFLAFLAVLYFNRRRTLVAPKAIVLIAGLETVSLLFQVIQGFLYPDASLLGQGRIAYQLIAFALFFEASLPAYSVLGPLWRTRETRVPG